MPITSARNASPTVVEIVANDSNGLAHASYALDHQVFTIRTEQLAGRSPLGTVDRPTLYRVKQALKIVFGIET